MLPALRTRVVRSLPFWMGGAFLVAAVGLFVSALLKNQSLSPRRILLASIAFAFVWGAVSAPITAYFLRKERQIPARSASVRGMFVFSLVWSLLFGAAGFVLLGCSFGAVECLAASNLKTAIVVALVIGGALSLMVLSS